MTKSTIIPLYAGDDEAGTLGVCLVESEGVAHCGGQAASQGQADAEAVTAG